MPVSVVGKSGDQTICAVVLAGGRATRMGGVDKGLVEVLGRPMVAYAVDAMDSQVSAVMINANRNQSTYQQYAGAVFSDEAVTDDVNDEQAFLGPLAGMLAAMTHATAPNIVTVPCDSPLVPNNLVQRLSTAKAINNVPIAVAHDGKRLQPVFSLLETKLQAPLRQFLQDGQRKIDRFFEQVGYVSVDFSDSPEAFLNINTEQDRIDLEQRLAVPESSSLAVNEPPVLGFAAFSGAGKTTLLKQLIPLLRARGLRVAVIKHAHHKFDVDVPGKDSHTLRMAGADQIIVSSKQRRAWIIEHDNDNELSLQALIAEMKRGLNAGFSHQPLDLIIVEGYKNAPIAKIEVHRPSLNAPLLANTDPHVVAVATDEPSILQIDAPLLDLNNIDAVADFVVDRIEHSR